MSENQELPASELTQPTDSKAQAPAVPEELAILPLFNVVIYPLTVIPLGVGQEQSIQLIDEAVLGERMIGLVTLKNEQERPEQITADDYYQIGTAAVVHRLLRLPDNTLRVAVQGIERIEIVEIIATEPYIRARVRVIPDETSDDLETQALIEQSGQPGPADLTAAAQPQRGAANPDHQRGRPAPAGLFAGGLAAVSEHRGRATGGAGTFERAHQARAVVGNSDARAVGASAGPAHPIAGAKRDRQRLSASTFCASSCAPSAMSWAKATKTPPRSSGCARRSPRQE